MAVELRKGRNPTIPTIAQEAAERLDSRKRKRKPDLSHVDAMRILRSGIAENRPASEFDWRRLDLALSAKKAWSDGVTIKDVQERMKASKTTAQRFLNEMVKSGQMETAKFPGPKTGWVAYYRFTAMRTSQKRRVATGSRVARTNR